ncbi:MAG: hypothetical protein IE880_05675 [Epsilonproteobacteria bacterium]|nr:hypothetical protein [Campylobacterota bacterium]
MKNLIKLPLSIFIVFLFVGCGKEPEPVRPVLQKTDPLEKFDENWPPKEEKEQNIDMSDLQINEVKINDKELQEFYNLPQNGNSTIFGKVALRLQNGHLINGSYANVYLVPQTSYTKRWFKGNYSSDEFAGSIDSRIYDFIKFTKSNNKGDFSFSNMPKGRYYLIGTMNCGVECGFEGNKSIRMANEIFVDKDGSVLKNIIKSL